MTTIRIPKLPPLSKTAIICLRAVWRKKPALVSQLLRSDRPLAAQDRADIADFIDGKFKRARGRPPGPTMKGDSMRSHLSRVKHVERLLKDAGVPNFRKEADRWLTTQLSENGCGKEYLITSKVPNARRRGKNNGGPKPPP